jgi:hypothetical protein
MQQRALSLHALTHALHHHYGKMKEFQTSGKRRGTAAKRTEY